MDETVRLGGMALGNGVLVHGPTSWACAVREPDGTIKVAAARKGFRASGVGSPLLRGPARLLEAMLVLPRCVASFRRRGSRSSGRACSARCSRPPR